MADFSALKTAIQANIRTNGNEEITGAILQDILLSMVTTMGDGAINALAEALQAEITNRQNAVSGEATTRAEADSELSGRINAEAQARGEADTQLSGRINAEATTRAEADTQLSNSITAITTRLNEGYVYAGIATPSANPGTPAGKVFYIALQAGTYTNFSSLAVTQGITILKYNGTAWSQEQLVSIDDEPTAGSNNLVKSGGVAKEFLKINGGLITIPYTYENGEILSATIGQAFSANLSVTQRKLCTIELPANLKSISIYKTRKGYNTNYRYAIVDSNNIVLHSYNGGSDNYPIDFENVDLSFLSGYAKLYVCTVDTYIPDGFEVTGVLDGDLPEVILDIDGKPTVQSNLKYVCTSAVMTNYERGTTLVIDYTNTSRVLVKADVENCSSIVKIAKTRYASSASPARVVITDINNKVLDVFAGGGGGGNMDYENIDISTYTGKKFMYVCTVEPNIIDGSFYMNMQLDKIKGLEERVADLENGDFDMSDIMTLITETEQECKTYTNNQIAAASVEPVEIPEEILDEHVADVLDIKAQYEGNQVNYNKIPEYNLAFWYCLGKYIASYRLKNYLSTTLIDEKLGTDDNIGNSAGKTLIDNGYLYILKYSNNYKDINGNPISDSNESKYLWLVKVNLSTMLIEKKVKAFDSYETIDFGNGDVIVVDHNQEGNFRIINGVMYVTTWCNCDHEGGSGTSGLVTKSFQLSDLTQLSVSRCKFTKDNVEYTFIESDMWAQLGMHGTNATTLNAGMSLYNGYYYGIMSSYGTGYVFMTADFVTWEPVYRIPYSCSEVGIDINSSGICHLAFRGDGEFVTVRKYDVTDNWKLLDAAVVSCCASMASLFREYYTYGGETSYRLWLLAPGHISGGDFQNRPVYEPRIPSNFDVNGGRFYYQLVYINEEKLSDSKVMCDTDGIRMGPNTNISYYATDEYLYGCETDVNLKVVRFKIPTVSRGECDSILSSLL